jgi:hypothetical protein
MSVWGRACGGLSLAILAATLWAGPVDDGRAALEKKDFPAAYAAFSQAFRENPDSVDAVLGLGLSAQALGYYDRAQFAFERVLTLEPGHPTARLELGRTYQQMGLLELARQEYLRILDSRPPEPVRQRIREELDRLGEGQSRLVLSGKASLEILYDSNVKFGPASDFVDTQLGELRVADDSKAKSAFGGALSVGVDSLYDFGARGGWGGIAGAGAYVEDLSGADDYAAQDFSAYAGGRLMRATWLLDLPLKARHFLMDWDTLVDIGGFNPAWAWAPAPAWRCYTAAGFELRNFDDNPRDSQYASLTETVRRSFGSTPGNGLAASAGVFQENADLGGYDNDGWELTLRGEKSLPFDLAVSAGVGYRSLRYDDVLYPLLQDEAREDRQWSGSVGLSRAFSNHVSTELSWLVEHTDSNFDLYTYRRQEVRLGATVWF